MLTSSYSNCLATQVTLRLIWALQSGGIRSAGALPMYRKQYGTSPIPLARLVCVQRSTKKQTNSLLADNHSMGTRARSPIACAHALACTLCRCATPQAWEGPAGIGSACEALPILRHLYLYPYLEEVCASPHTPAKAAPQQCSPLQCMLQGRYQR